LLTPNQKRNLGKILPFGFVWMLFGILYVILEQGYNFQTNLLVISIGSLMMGLIMGSVEVLYLSKKFLQQSFGTKILAKILIYVAAICIFLIINTVVSNSFAYGLSPFHSEVLSSIFNFLFTSFAFWSIVMYIGVIVAITLFVSEISDNIGQGVLLNFLTGKYHKPRVEERIFMFLDMKSSTAIAEKMGHVKYYELLNTYFADITEALIQKAGRIYQYVGDEVVVRWNMDEGLKDNNCLKCFFLIKQIFREKAELYRQKYGLVPGFKAGFHYGKVTMGEIGVVKKEIIFTGDVLNTTARIQGLCNAYDVDLLISEDLLKLLDTTEEFEIREMGDSVLRGRQKKVKLFTVSSMIKKRSNPLDN